MTKSKSKPATVTTVKLNGEVQFVRVDRINAKIHDLNIESVKEVERLQALIKEYQDIVRSMYFLEPMYSIMKEHTSLLPRTVPYHTKAKIKEFFNAMQKRRKE